jgi:AAA+ superfamily predicted ATPase
MTSEPTTTAKPAPALPEWYPAWTKELAELYFSGTINTFVLYGNVHDLVRCQDDGQTMFVDLPDFLATQVFGNWDVALSYDLGRGLRPLAGDDAKRLQRMVQFVSGVIGAPNTWPRDPDKVLDLLEPLLQRNLLEDNVQNRKRLALLFEYSQLLLPSGDLSSQARGQAARLVRFLGWAANPYIKRLNVAFCLITEKLSELSERLVNSPYVATIEIPLPGVAERREFVAATRGRNPHPSPLPAGEGKSDHPGPLPEGEVNADRIAAMSAGLSLVNLNVLLSQGGPRGFDVAQFRKLKKGMIERQCQGLVEFVEPPHKLDLLVGQPQAKARLEQDAAWITQGKLETAPMGYLFCGPVGTGKTFFAECYAGSIGIPCLKLRNFRSKYVGETEGNIEQVLTVLRSLGPVVVIVDEADASLGDRQTDGDSGTSGRVFSMIAQQMGDTRYRGQIIWMLLTSRPDLLPIDLKRQGRCEVHIPLFPPQDSAEIATMFRAMAKKNKISLGENAIPDVSADKQLSGADLESILLSARRKSLLAGHEQVQREDLTAALDEFIPSAQSLEKEMQELAAVLECTDRNFLPAMWRDRIAQPGARAKMQERLVALRQLIEE